MAWTTTLFLGATSSISVSTYRFHAFGSVPITLAYLIFLRLSMTTLWPKYQVACLRDNRALVSPPVLPSSAYYSSSCGMARVSRFITPLVAAQLKWNHSFGSITRNITCLRMRVFICCPLIGHTTTSVVSSGLWSIRTSAKRVFHQVSFRIARACLSYMPLSCHRQVVENEQDHAESSRYHESVGQRRA